MYLIGTQKWVTEVVALGYYIMREQVDLWSWELVLEWIKEHENNTDIMRFFLMVGRLFF